MARRAPQTPVPRRIGITAAGLVVLVIAQIYLGALVAGLHAGLIYNTWPLIDGALVPPGLLFDQPAWRNFFENPLTVQFDHRMLAYGLVAVALFHVVDVWRSVEGRALRIGAAVLAAVVCAQAALGIVTLADGGAARARHAAPGDGARRPHRCDAACEPCCCAAGPVAGAAARVRLLKSSATRACDLCVLSAVTSPSR